MGNWVLKTARTMAHLHTPAGVFSLEYKTDAQKLVVKKLALAEEMLALLKGIDVDSSRPLKLEQRIDIITLLKKIEVPNE